MFAEVVPLFGDVSGRRVCDLACGQGRVARYLADRGARVVGVDISSRMLAADLPSDVRCGYAPDHVAAVDWIRSEARAGDTVLIMGARALFGESLAMQLAHNNTPGVAECLLGFAALAVKSGLPASGARLPHCCC